MKSLEKKERKKNSPEYYCNDKFRIDSTLSSRKRKKERKIIEASTESGTKFLRVGASYGAGGIGDDLWIIHLLGETWSLLSPPKATNGVVGHRWELSRRVATPSFPSFFSFSIFFYIYKSIYFSWMEKFSLSSIINILIYNNNLLYNTPFYK